MEFSFLCHVNHHIYRMCVSANNRQKKQNSSDLQKVLQKIVCTYIIFIIASMFRRIIP